MLIPKPRAQALLQQIDKLIDQETRKTTPDAEFLRDLHTHRAALQDATKRTPGDYAKDALRVATWIKFFFDHWPPDL